MDMGADEAFPIAGDFEPDADVDLGDLGQFNSHMRGPVFIVTYGCLDADLDADTDCDMRDFELLAAEFGRQSAGPGDIDGDEDVDLDDLTLFVQCVFGPVGEPLPPSGAAADFDYDGHCDLTDMDIFARHFTGPLE